MRHSWLRFLSSFGFPACIEAERTRPRRQYGQARGVERVRVDIAGFHLRIGDVHYLLRKIKNFFGINMTMASDSARPTLAVCVND